MKNSFCFLVTKAVVFISIISFMFIASCSSSDTTQEKNEIDMKTTQTGTPSDDVTYYGVTDKQGNIYLVGYTKGIIDETCGRSTTRTDADVFLIKYNADGTLAWKRQWGTTSDDIGETVAVDQYGYVYITGSTKGIMAGSINYGDEDAFLKKIAPDGTDTGLAAQWGSSGWEATSAVVVDNAGYIYVVDTTSGTLGTNPDESTPPPASIYDGYVRKMSQNISENRIEEVWTRRWGSPQPDGGYGVAVNSNGDVFVGGNTFGNFGGGTNSGQSDNIIIKYSSSGTRRWVKYWGDTGIEYIYSMAFDSQDNLIVSGETTSKLDSSIVSPFGGYDIFLAKYPSNMDASTSPTWVKQFGSSANDTLSHIVTDTSDNIYLVGTTGGALPNNISAGGKDFFFAKYKSDGTQLWLNQRGTSSDDETKSIYADKAGDIYISGHTKGNLDGNTNAGGGNYDLFIYKYIDNQKNWFWTKQVGTNTEDKGYATTTDSSGNIYVTGSTKGSLVSGVTNQGGKDAYLIKYNADGSLAWTKQWGTSGDDEGDSVVTDAQGNVFVLGTTKGAMDSQTYSGNEDIFVKKFSKDGVARWTKEFGTLNSDWANQIAIGKNDRLYIVGQTTGRLGTLEDGQSFGSTIYDGFIARITDKGSIGLIDWIRQIGTMDQIDGLYSIAVDNDENLYTTGNTYGSLYGATSSGGSDIIVLKYNNSGVKQWSVQWGTTTAEYGYSATVDSSGRVYISGSTMGSLYATNAGQYDFFVASINGSNGSRNWGRQIGTSTREDVSAISVDKDGYIYLAGRTYKTTATPSGIDGNNGIGGSDYFITRYDMFGYKSWTKQRGTTGDEEAKSLAIDKMGNLYVTGSTTGDIDGYTNSGGDCDPNTAGVQTCPDIFLVKFSDEPSKEWPKQWGTTTLDYGYAVATDRQGDIIVGGTSSGNMDGNTNSGSRDNFITKWYANGTKAWTKMWGTSYEDMVLAVAADSSGNIFAAGYTLGSLDGNTNPSVGTEDIFLTKWSADGTTKVWTKQWGNTSSQKAQGVAVDSSGNIFVTGYTAGNLDGNTSAGVNDIFLTKWNADGTKAWTKQWGTSNSEYGYAVAIDSNGDIYVTGNTFSSLDGNTSSGNSDIFLTKWYAGGTKAWTKQWGTNGIDYGKAVTVDNQGNIYVSGYTAGTLPSNVSAGGNDAFVTKWTQSGTTATMEWSKQWGSLKYGDVEVVKWGLTTNGLRFATPYISDGLFSKGSGIGTITFNANGATANSWTTGAIDLTDYYEAKFTAAMGSSVAITAINFSEKRSDTGIRAYKVRYSKSSSFTNPVDLATVDVPDNVDTRVGNITNLNIPVNVGETIYIRFYGYSAEASTGTWTITPNLTIQGTIVGPDDQGASVAVDAQGSVYVGGSTIGSIDGNINPAAGVYDYFISKYLANGTRVWTAQGGSSSTDYLGQICTDKSGNLFATGYTNGSLPNNTNVGTVDIFLTKISEAPGSTVPQMVSCSDNKYKPANSSNVDALVSVTYSNASGWSKPAECDWSCNSGYHTSDNGAACDQNDCSGNDTQAEECGINNKGIRTRTCENYHWGSWGNCIDQCFDGSVTYFTSNCTTGSKKYICTNESWVAADGAVCQCTNSAQKCNGGQCTNCQANSVCAVNSDQQEYCQCNDGYVMSGGACVVNSAPNTPAIGAGGPANEPDGNPCVTLNTTPANTVTLSWTDTDPDSDTLTYTVLMDTVPQPEKTATLDANKNVVVSGGTRYYWQVVAKDAHDYVTTSPIWTFTTCGTVSAPTLTGTMSATMGSAGALLAWPVSSSSGVTGYILSAKKSSETDYKPLKKLVAGQYTVANNTVTYRYIGLDFSTNYKFRVAACNAQLCSTPLEYPASGYVSTTAKENSVVYPTIHDSNAIITFFESYKFLFVDIGSNPKIQHFFDADSINIDGSLVNVPKGVTADNVSIIQGRVLDISGNPVIGALVYIKDHPELGYTYTQDDTDNNYDGTYNLAVPGGISYAVITQPAGSLPVYRNIKTEMQGFSYIDEVRVITQPATGTSVTFSAGTTAFEPIVTTNDTDGRGNRTLRVNIAADTTAEMEMQDGTKKPLDTSSAVTITAVEYTATSEGQNAMPARLPENTQYTYCVELGIAEATAQGAKDVHFNKPVYVYLDNFINAPVGIAVPAGYYDRAQDKWIASENGIVLRVVSITTEGGIDYAELDMDGDGVPEKHNILQQLLGITRDERQKIAEQYGTAGETFWRVGIMHFSPWDFNFPALGYLDNVTDPDLMIAGESVPTEDSCTQNGSIIDCENGTFGESFSIADVPHQLTYNSGYTLGDLRSRKILFKDRNENISGTFCHDFSAILLFINGRAVDSTRLLPLMSLTWDGKDRFGRKVNKQVDATVKAIYRYSLVRGGFPFVLANKNSFGSPPVMMSGSSTGGSGSGSVISYYSRKVDIWGYGEKCEQNPEFLIKNYRVKIGSFADDQKLGGWNFDKMHRFDKERERVYKGNGESFSARPEVINIEHYCNFTPSNCVNFFGGGIDVRPNNGKIVGIYSFKNQWCSTADNGKLVEFTRVLAPDGSATCSLSPLSVDAFAPYGAYKIRALEDGSIYIHTMPDMTNTIPGRIYYYKDGNNTLVAGGGSRTNLKYGDSGDNATELDITYDTVFDVTENHTVYLHVKYPDSTGVLIQILPDGRYVVISDKFVPVSDSQRRVLNADDSIFSSLSKHYLHISNLEIPGNRFLHANEDNSLVIAMPEHGCAYSVDEAGTATKILGPSCYSISGAGSNGAFGMESPEGYNRDAESIQGLFFNKNLFDHFSDGNLLFHSATTTDYFTNPSSPNGDDLLYYLHLLQIKTDQLTGSRVLYKIAGDDNKYGYHRIVTSTKIVGEVYSTVMTPESGPGGPQEIRIQAAMTDKEGNIYLKRDSDGVSIIRKPKSFQSENDAGNTTTLFSKDGSEVYKFDKDGYHLQTLDAITGVAKYTFKYSNDTDEITCSQNIEGVPVAVKAVTKITDAFGNTTVINRDSGSECKATSITSPNGHVTTLTVNSSRYLTNLLMPGGTSYGFTYYSGSQDGLLHTITDPKGNYKEIKYTADGRFLEEIDPLGGVKSLEEPDAATKTKEFTSPEGVVTSYTKAGAGKVVRFADGTENKLTKDNGKNIVTYADGTSIETGYSNDPRIGLGTQYVSSKTIKTGDLQWSLARMRTSDTPSIDIYAFNSITDRTTINSKVSISTITRNAGTPPVTYTLTNTSPLNKTVTSTADSKGRITGVTMPGTDPVTYAYNDDVDHGGKLVSVAQNTRQTTIGYYTAAGPAKGYINYISRFIKRVWESGTYYNYYNLVSFEYDDKGMVTTQNTQEKKYYDNGSEAGSTNAGIIAYAYDANGNVTSVAPISTEPAHFFEYSPLNQVDWYDAPMITYSEPFRTVYAYDKDSNMTDVVKPDGNKIHFEYFTKSEGYSGSQLTGKLHNIQVNNTPVITYDYQPTGGKKLSSITSANATLTYTYNGMLPASETWSGVASGTVSRTYNNDLRVNNVSVTGGASITYGYDNDGLMLNAGAMTLTRGTDGRVSGTTIGAIGTTSTYNSYGEIANFTATGMQTPANYSYTINSANGRDSLGRIIERTEVINSVSTLYDYTYDEAGRLKDVYIGGVLTRSYGYDQNGNRTARTGVSNINYDDQDRLTSYGNYNYVYTSNGDLYTKTDTKGTPSTLDDEITTYTHDALGNLTSVALPGGPTITYKYDGRNRLIERRSGGTIDYTLIYNGQIAPVAKYGSGGTLIETYVYATGSNSPDYIVNGGTNYRVIKDHVGSPRLVINTSTGAVVKRIDYDEFGIVTSESGAFNLIFGFAGGIRDASTSLTKFGARWYDPMTGRWIEKEPLGFRGSMNFYVYANGDPVNKIDNNGLKTTVITNHDGGLGHTALLIENDLFTVLWDPSGSYSNFVNGNTQEDIIYGDKANISDYKNYHKDEQINTKEYETTWKDEIQMLDRIEDMASGSICSQDVHEAIKGLGPFKDDLFARLASFLPFTYESYLGDK